MARFLKRLKVATEESSKTPREFLNQGPVPLSELGNAPEASPWPSRGTKIEKIRWIYDNAQSKRVDGVLVDGFSASAIVQVYDALGPENKEKFVGQPVSRMAQIAFQLINKGSR